VKGREFSIFEPYNRLPLKDRPIQYSRKDIRTHEISEYLDDSQLAAYRKRNRKRREDTFEESDPFNLRGGKRAFVSISDKNRRLDEMNHDISTQSIVSVYNIMIGCILLFTVIGGIVLYRRRREYIPDRSIEISNTESKSVENSIL
jgi:hypothetical protein